MKKIAGVINGSKDEILLSFEAFTGLETYVYPFLEKEKHLHNLAKESEVTHYYNLTRDSKKSYY